MPRRNREEGEIRVRRLFDFESNLQLQDLPDDVIREILEFSQPLCCLCSTRWRFISQIGAVCRVFYRVSKQLSTPPLTVPLYDFPVRRGETFLQSLLDFPSRALSVRFILAELDNEDLFAEGTMLRSLLTTPGIFVNVTGLDLRGFEAYAGDLHSTIDQLCQNLPNLSDLRLEGYPSPRLPRLSVQQFSSFASGLPRPLRKLRINGSLFTKAQIMEFIRQNGRELESLHLCHRLNVTEDNILDDEIFPFIAQHSPQLVELRIPYSSITSGGFESYLRAHRTSFVYLDLTGCQNLTSEVIHHLVNYAPGLKTFRANHCVWFNDEGLETLVQGQLDRMRQTGADDPMPLEYVRAAYGSSVTRDGAMRILAKYGVGKLTISGSRWKVSSI